MTVIAAVALAPVVLAFGWSLFAYDPLGGEPTAEVAIERRLAQAPAVSGTPGTPSAPDAPKPDHAAAPQPEFRDGVPVVRPGDPMPKSGPVIIRVPGADDAAPGRAAAVRGANPGEVDKALLEDSRYGALPRMAEDGRRPLDVYARAAPKAKTGPRIALVVGGLGVGREATAEALRRLPPEVSVAFSPYAPDVAELVTQARGAGREALMQAPMEPFDYPANDPGPQTLLTSLPASANLERLRWSLGRAQGYVGVAPLAGARFLDAQDALQPMLVELARRGLMFVVAADRGGRAADVAEEASLPHATSVVAIDQTDDADTVDAGLAKLESEAKADPSRIAVGWITATPLTLNRIDAWRAGLAQRGAALAPVSAVAGAQGPS